MSKILITGNGFDLFHHLPTKYHHFISIMETIEKFQFKKEVSFTDLFGRFFKDRFPSDFDLIVENYNVEQIKFDNTKIIQIDILLKSNLWYKHFKNVTEIDTWIDFELEIENILNQFEIFNKHQDKRVIKKNAFDDYLFDFTDFELFQIIKKKSIGQIPFSLNKKYINERNSSIDISKMLDDLAKSFEDFIVIFNHYLVDIVVVFYPEIIHKSTIPFHLMDEIYSFNYTPTLENIYKVDKSKVVYLHGKINEDSQKQNLVLGVSDINDEIKKNKMFDFTKYYQKVRKKTNHKFINIPEAKNDLPESIFYIFGHSLDNSDKEYISDLFKFLELDRNKKSKVCVFYLDESDYRRKLNNLLSIIDKNKIQSFNKERRLYFEIIDNQNVTQEFHKKLDENTSFFVY